MSGLRSLALCLPLALLAACGEDPAEDDARSATGEVLEGTISDDMLPLDQLQSEPPLLAPERAPSAGGGQAEEAAADAEETVDAEEPGAEEAPSEGAAAEPEEAAEADEG